MVKLVNKTSEIPPAHKMKKSRVILLVILLVALTVGFFFLPLRQWFIELEGHVQSLGTLGPVVVALAYVLCTVLLIPASIITLGAGTIFGLKTGFIVVVIGANLGALCSFLLARTFLREKVARWAQANSKFRFLDEAIGRQGFKMVLLTRLSPIFPFILLNYFLGLNGRTYGCLCFGKSYWHVAGDVSVCIHWCGGARRY